MSIQILPEDVAAQIAAGEVIERPMSVVKELLDNAIDAGADDIRVEIRDGGARLIRVSDNGCGIPATEAEIAFQRHATSKLRTAADLERIATLGFRGEALSSIAAVSQLTLLTRTAHEEMGTRLRLEGGTLVQREGHGTPVGTSVAVENLFYNVPARRKFLRSEGTESAHITALITRYALAWPGLRFSLKRNERLAFQSSGSGEMIDVILKVYDLETTRRLIDLHHEENGILVWGYASLPSLTRADRGHQSIFVNRRWVQDRVLTRALLDAYHGLLPSGRFPVAILHVEMDPSEIDVNVHPTKAEIRYRRSRDVFTAVQKAVRQALSQADPVRAMETPPRAVSGPAYRQGATDWPHRPSVQWGRLALDLQHTGDSLDPSLSGSDMILHAGPAGQTDLEKKHENGSVPRNLPPLRVLGQVSQTYIIAEGPAGLYLIDQHTAHERILYERLRGEQARQAAIQQHLLSPVTVELPPVQSATLLEQLDKVKALGFEIEPFGGDTLLVRAIPAPLGLNAISDTLGELAVKLAGGGDTEDLFEEALLVIVCHSAVRAGQTLSSEAMRDLIRQLEMTSMPHTCPHGRPIFLHLSTDRLASAFGRR